MKALLLFIAICYMIAWFFKEDNERYWRLTVLALLWALLQ